MATNLQIDEKLIQKAMKLGGHKTKKAAVTIALTEYIERLEQQEIIPLFGSVEYVDPIKQSSSGSFTTKSSELNELYQEIFICRKCDDVIESPCRRKMIPETCDADLALVAQAPSEKGVRMSGVHWVDEEGRLKRPGGTFLDKYLKTTGYSVDPENTQYRRPYTTNVLHCWTGPIGKFDRTPSKKELHNCKQWWINELQIVQPLVLLILGKPASETFASVCGSESKFVELLQRQGERITLGSISVLRYNLPHSVAPYPEKSRLYSEIFRMITQCLED